jgi:hypothetical protein
MPLSPDLDQIGEGKVQNTLKAKCAINFFEHFNHFECKNSELESCRFHQDLQLSNFKIFYFMLCIIFLCLNYLKFKILKMIDDDKWKGTENLKVIDLDRRDLL